MISLLLVKKIVELFMIMFAAFAIVRAGELKSEDSRVISRLCIYTVYPCMIVNGFRVDMTPEIRNGMLLSAGAAFALNVLMVVLGHIFEKAAKTDTVERASVQFSNTGNLIIPLVSSIFGEKWVIYTSTYIAFQNLFFWTLGVRLFSRDEKFSLKKLFGNANMIAIGVGLVLLFTGISLPGILQNAVSSLAGMAGPCAMFVTGMLLASADLKAIVRNRRLYLMAFLRLVVCPAAALAFLKLTGAAYWLPEARTILLISYLAASAPAPNLTVILAQMYGRDAVYAGTITIFTTLLCVVTMPLFVYLYELIM